ncbi:Site-specific DNA recombinase [Ruminococcus sp. YE71]|uniref:recombinase family protein n=1 Tax=unclassified Ruminococcus TaxID=2608920 RepID=UPI0008898F73|nr:MULTISPECIES: recombinase family protein [unclassified Ruminococcus]SDA29548.1 Site-specific DNA recombinase [Ruminococcus sp. YE78]SFW48469.1 Site-specific DNA recombinase [Ruminococcus sp. YE71]
MNTNNIKTASNVIVIPALTKNEMSPKRLKQTRVAAYCRVSTDQDEQQNSYQVQISYYTDYINRNPEWCMAGIFADEGISGTQTKNRTQFGRMIRKCRQGKIDLILCKSISRFARNTVDCLGYIRELKSLGIGVIFEKENIDTLNMTSEFIISLYGSFAQAESESISKNVTWGIEKQFREGKVRYNMSTVLGYRMGDDGKPYIVEEEAEIVREIFKMYLDGMTLNTIAEILTAKGAKRRNGSSEWQKNNIRVILRNEKYVGDAILQKTYTKDCITHKRLINYGDRTKYLIHDCHVPIIDRDTYNRVQQEIARRNSVQQKSTRTKTEQGKYSGLYALSEIMVCGECGSQYRRVTWTSHGHKLIVWRCINRLDHGNRYCKCSPSLNEEKLHNAIVGAMNEIYKSDSSFLDMIEQNIGCAITESDELGHAITKIEDRLTEIEKVRDDLIQLVTAGSIAIESSDDKFKALGEEESYLRTQLTALKTKSDNSNDIRLMLKTISDELKKYSGSLLEYDDMTVRKTIECIRVMSKIEIEITFRGGFEMKAAVEK